MAEIEIIYDAIPTLAPFHESSAFSRLIVGPFRSGKSVAAVVELFKIGLSMRNCRTVCVRNSYRELKDTVIKTFFEWIPRGATGKWSEADLTYSMKTPFGGMWEVLFRSADSPDDIGKFKGLELTNYWIDEAIEVSSEVKMILDGRLSYPKGSPERVFRSILTSNPGDTESWIYKMYVKNPLPGHVIWHQSARENPHLHKEYYDNLAANYRDRDELKRRYVDGEWGAVHSGKAVYGEEFHHATHVSKVHLVPAPDVVINRGWDFGLSPACVVTQVHPNGQWQVLRELWSDDSSVDEFGDNVVEFCNREYPGYTFEDVGDPAGRARSATDEKSCMDILAAKNIYCSEAETNALIPRLEAVKRRLSKTVKGRPRMVIDPRCSRLVEGFVGGYCYEERGSKEIYSDKPKKDKYSHVHDALQYVAMRLFGYAEHNAKIWSEPLKIVGVVNA